MSRLRWSWANDGGTSEQGKRSDRLAAEPVPIELFMDDNEQSGTSSSQENYHRDESMNEEIYYDFDDNETGISFGLDEALLNLDENIALSRNNIMEVNRRIEHIQRTQPHLIGFEAAPNTYVLVEEVEENNANSEAAEGEPIMLEVDDGVQSRQI